MSADIDRLVRRVDEDRWLASRFAPEGVRRRLIAIYALNYEIAHASEVAEAPALAQMRLAWWRGAIEAVHQGMPEAGHPVLTAYSNAASGLPVSLWSQIIEARASETERFSSWEAMEAYLASTSGGVMKLAMLACGASITIASGFAASAALAWGYQGFLRTPGLRARLPGNEGFAIERAAAAHAAARKIASTLSAKLFPAIGHIALVPGHLRAFTRGRGERALFVRQLVLVGASATGRI